MNFINITPPYLTLSLYFLELAAEIFSEVKKDNGLERLHVEEVAEFNQNAYVSTCSLVLAILYLEKIKNTNPEYVEKIAPSELFLVSLVSITLLSGIECCYFEVIFDLGQMIRYFA